MTTVLIVVFIVAALCLAAYAINEKNEKRKELEAEKESAKLAPEKIEPQPQVIELVEKPVKKSIKKKAEVEPKTVKTVVKKVKK